MSPQPGMDPFIPRENTQSEEECLALNLWTASLDGARPVFVWIHGGGFRQGTGSMPLTDGAALARRGVVVVTVTYRLGALGFLTHPELAVDGHIGNWAVLDLVAGLEWVRDNIAAFGGDPGNVTVVGESAGSALTADLTVATPARGLVHKVICESGPSAAVTMARATAAAEALRDALGVGSVAAIRDVPVADLLAAQTSVEAQGRPMSFMPVVDGTVFEKLPVELLRDGAAAGIPALIGTNADESRLAAFAIGEPSITDEHLRKRLAKTFTGGIDDVIETFRRERAARGETTEPIDVWCAIESDRFFRVPSLRDADARPADGAPTFVYLWTWPARTRNGLLGACHVLEIAFVFGTHRQPMSLLTLGTDEEDALADQVMDAWIAFASTGDPSTARNPWPRYDADTQATMVIDTDWSVEKAPRAAERAAIARWGKGI